MHIFHTNRTHQPGVAMALVLIALSVGTVLAAATLASRDNSPAIGANACDFSAAGWSANAGAEVAMAIMETNIDWVELTGGDLLTNFPIAGGVATVTLTNTAGLEPTDADRELLLTVVATVGGMTSTTQKRLSVVPPAPVEVSISPYLDEFAIFATSSLDVEANAQIKPASVSPEITSLYPIKIGAGFNSLGGLNISESAKITRGSLFVDASASGSLAGAVNNNSNLGTGAALPLRVPAHPIKLPTEITSLPVRNNGDSVNIAVQSKWGQTDTDVTLSSSGKYGNVNIAAGGILRVNEANGQYYQFDSLDIFEDGALRITGKVTIHVKGHFDMEENATVTLDGEGAAVRFLTSDDIEIDDATFGFVDSFETLPRDPANLESFANPARFRIMTVDPASGGKAVPDIRLRNNSVVLACIHAPNAAVELRDNSFVVGRITAKTLRVRGGSGIYYEPLLDSRTGFTALYGPMYEEGAPLTEVVTTIAGYVNGEGAESLHGRIVEQAKLKWDAQPDDAWFTDESKDANSLDPFVNILVLDVLEDQLDFVGQTLGQVLGGVLGGVGVGGGGGGGVGGGGGDEVENPPVVQAPQVPALPNRRFAGKIFSAPVTLAAQKLED